MYNVTENWLHMCNETNTSVISNCVTIPDTNASARSLPASIRQYNRQSPNHGTGTELKFIRVI
jgi:hypothetical protein